MQRGEVEIPVCTFRLVLECFLHFRGKQQLRNGSEKHSMCSVSKGFGPASDTHQDARNSIFIAFSAEMWICCFYSSFTVVSAAWALPTVKQTTKITTKLVKYSTHTKQHRNEAARWSSKSTIFITYLEFGDDVGVSPSSG